MATKKAAKKKKPKKRYVTRQGRRVLRIERECLKCEKKFNAKGKFNRICRHCKDLYVFQSEEETSANVLGGSVHISSDWKMQPIPDPFKEKK